MPAIQIGSQDYQAYASLAEADEYLAGDFAADAWRAEEDDEKLGRALITASRILDRMPWAGEKADDDQALAWPRVNTGISDVADDEIPLEIVHASIVLANLVYGGSNVDSSVSTATNIKRQKAGSVEQEFFRPGEPATRLPTAVHELVRRFLAGAGFSSGAIASGVSSCDPLSPDYRIGQPF